MTETATEKCSKIILIDEKEFRDDNLFPATPAGKTVVLKNRRD